MTAEVITASTDPSLRKQADVLIDVIRRVTEKLSQVPGSRVEGQIVHGKDEFIDDSITSMERNLASGYYGGEKGAEYLSSLEAWWIGAVIEAISNVSDNDCVESVGFAWEILEELSNSRAMESNGNSVLMKLLDYVREIVLKSDSNADSLTNEPHSADAFRFYLAAERAYAKDFENATSMIDDMQASPGIQAVLRRLLNDAINEEYQGLHVNEDESREHLNEFIKKIGISPDIEPESLHSDSLGVSVGTTFETLEGLFGAQREGRYLSAHEHATSGGHDHFSTRQNVRDTPYHHNRSRVETLLGRPQNVFVPRPIYGAISSDLQSDGSSGYGSVTISVKQELVNDRGTTFTFGDSLNFAHSKNPRALLLNAEDAVTAYKYLMCAKIQGINLEYPYIEAQLPGLCVGDIDKISLRFNLGRGEGKKVAELASTVAQNGIQAEIVVDWYQVRDYYDPYQRNGASVDYDDMLKKLSKLFGSNSEIKIIIVDTPRQNEPESVIDNKPDEERLKVAGISVRYPVVPELSLD